MRKIKIIEHISLDGVIQGPGGPNEDDYPYGGWTVPYRDPAAGGDPRGAYQELRSAAGPTYLRYLGRLLAES